MDTSYEEEEEEEEEEAAPLISRTGIPTAVQDNRRDYEKQLAVYIILACTLLERVAFYTLAANLAFQLESEKGGAETLNPSMASLFFSGTSYVSTIVFAIISDWKLGRGKTILGGFVIYILGYALAATITAPVAYNCTKYILNGTSTSPMDGHEQLHCYAEIIPPLILIAIGAGAVQSNMAVFGAEQIQESKIESRYFEKYVIVLNISAIIGVLVIRTVYNPTNNFKNPSIIAASAVLAAAVLFLVGWRFYIHVVPFDTVAMNCIPVYRNAFHTRRVFNQKARTLDEAQVNSTSSNSISTYHAISDDAEPTTIDERPTKFLDFAKAVYGGKFPDRMVDDVKSLRKAFIVFTLLIPYWLIYHQLSTTFALQAKYMYNAYENRMATEESTKIDIVTYMWLGDPVTIIIGILILIIFVHKCLAARRQSLTISTKFVIGMCFAFMTMNIAGTVEIFRQQKCDRNYGFSQSNLTALYQLPQNIFMGLSEIFAMVASFEYAYFAAPRSAQTLFMSLRFCSLGVSSFIASGYFTIFSYILPEFDFRCPSNRENQWRFYSYFFVLGGLQLVFIIIFIISQKKYNIIKLNPQQMVKNQFVAQTSKTSTRRN